MANDRQALRAFLKGLPSLPFTLPRWNEQVDDDNRAVWHFVDWAFRWTAPFALDESDNRLVKNHAQVMRDVGKITKSSSANRALEKVGYQTQTDHEVAAQRSEFQDVIQAAYGAVYYALHENVVYACGYSGVCAARAIGHATLQIGTAAACVAWNATDNPDPHVEELAWNYAKKRERLLQGTLRRWFAKHSGDEFPNWALIPNGWPTEESDALEEMSRRAEDGYGDVFCTTYKRAIIELVAHG